jgi:uncharacterized membrane protein YfcA
MTPAIILGIAASGLAIGIAIGAVGIGGVLLVPILTLALGIEVKQAIAAVLFAYLPGGTVAVILYARRGSRRPPAACPVCFSRQRSASCCLAAASTCCDRRALTPNTGGIWHPRPCWASARSPGLSRH